MKKLATVVALIFLGGVGCTTILPETPQPRGSAGQNAEMMDIETYEAILDSVNYPIVFVDNDHIIRYLNKRARMLYYEESGHSDLIGKPLLDCHSPATQDKIKEFHARLQQGEDEIPLESSEGQQKITVMAVRNSRGELLGFYERFETVDELSSAPDHE